MTLSFCELSTITNDFDIKYTKNAGNLRLFAYTKIVENTT